MGMGTHIRVDAECYLSYLALGLGQLVDNFQLGHGFYVEAEDVVVEGLVDFLVGLSDTGIHNLVAWKTGLHGSTNFASAHAISTQTG